MATSSPRGSSLREKLALLRSRSLSASENIERFLKVISERDRKVHAFLHLNPEARGQAEQVDRKLKAGRAGKLAGLAIAVKSNISVKGLPVTCASKALENYRGTFDADAIQRIRQEDGIVIGMSNMDEFACGSSGETSYFGATDNPASPGRIPGGSSSGSAAAVAAGMCDLALGSDTGGSIRTPASHCGVAGVKPSYGTVSRYGLVDMAMSLEGIGTLSRDVYGSALLLEVISGESPNDATTQPSKKAPYTRALEKPVRKLRIGVSKDFERMCTDKRIYGKMYSSAQALARETGSEVEEVKLEYFDLAIQAYYVLTYVEFFSATRKFDGRRYGRKIEENCGEEVLRRILGGREISKAEHRGRHYRRALKAKALIAQDFAKAFQRADVLALPTTPMLPHKLGTRITDPRVMYAYDAFTVPANLAGICGGVVSAGRIDSIPVGLQVLAPPGREELLLRVMKTFEGLSGA